MKTARTGGVVRAGAVMAVATLFSRITGFLSKVVLLSVLGFGIVNDAYTLANTLPNIIFELLIGGVLTSVAIPLLSRARSDPDGGTGYTQRLVTVALVGLLGATLLAVAAAPLLTRLYLSGDDGAVDQGLANALAYLLLPQIFFYGIAALFGAILNTKEKFGIPAWAPVANNLLVIVVGVVLHLMPSEQVGSLTSLTREQYLRARPRHDGRDRAPVGGDAPGTAAVRIPVPLAVGRRSAAARGRWPAALGRRVRARLPGRVHRHHQRRLGTRPAASPSTRSRRCSSSCRTGSSGCRS